MVKIVIATLAATIVSVGGGLVLANHGSSASDHRLSRNSYAKDQCFQSEWKTGGFKNQGQCMRFYSQPDTYDADRYN